MISTVINDVFTASKRTTYVTPTAGFYGTPCYEAGLDYFRTFDNVSLGGFKVGELKSLYDIYELIHPHDLQQVIDFSVRAINFANSKKITPMEVSSEIIFRVKGRHGKSYYYNRRAIANGITGDGAISHNFTMFDDIGWMKPGGIGAYKLLGIDTTAFDLDVPELVDYLQVLSIREIVFLKLLAHGFSSRDIGAALCISIHTVNTHRRNMLKKLEASNTSELLMMARDMNLLL